MSTEAALELDAEAAGESRGVEVHFSNFPGLWASGRPVAVSELGFESADEALARVRELGLPLREVDVEAGSAPMPARDNHVANEEQQRAIMLAEAGGQSFATHAAADAAAAASGAEWPRPKMTLAEKKEFLDSYAAGEIDESGDEPGGEA